MLEFAKIYVLGGHLKSYVAVRAFKMLRMSVDVVGSTPAGDGAYSSGKISTHFD